MRSLLVLPLKNFDEFYLRSEEKLNDTGIKMLAPYISNILTYLHLKLLSSSENMTLKSRKKMKFIISDIQLSVLTLLCDHMVNHAQSKEILNVLFPLLQCMQSEESRFRILTIIENLLPHIDERGEYVKFMANLFSILLTRRAREILCRIYLKISESDPEQLKVAVLINDLNSWDTKHLNQPSYDKIFAAFKDITNKINEFSTEQLLPILKNCLYFIVTSEDVAVREVACGTVEDIIDRIREDNEKFNDIIVKTIVPAVKNGFKSQKEVRKP